MKLSVDLAKAMVTQWNIGGDLLHALLAASPTGGESHPSEWWDEQMAKHGLLPNTYLKQDARVWIAKHFDKANEALYNGKQELAWKWMASGKDSSRSPKPRLSTEARREMKANYKGKLLVSVRERDTRRNWNVCK